MVHAFDLCPSWTVAAIGTKRIKYLEENIAAFNIKLSVEDLAEIEEAIPADKVHLLMISSHD